VCVFGHRLPNLHLHPKFDGVLILLISDILSNYYFQNLKKIENNLIDAESTLKGSTLFIPSLATCVTNNFMNFMTYPYIKLFFTTA
jgi:hypothetical protein